MKHSFGIRFGRALLIIFRPLIWLLLPHKIIGREKLHTDQSVIVCCNHISAFDPVLLLVASRYPIYFMGKDSLFKNKLAGYVLSHWFGVFPVSRGHNDSSAINRAFQVLEHETALGIFPEGTRSKDGTLGAAKSGAALIAAKSNASIIPCALIPSKGPRTFLSKTTVVIGDALTPEELHLKQDRPDLRFASRTIMATIADMMEEHRV